MNEQYKKAIDWVDKKLSEPDIENFYLEPHLFCKSLHKILKIHKHNLLNTKFFIQKNAYYQIKKIKDNYEN